MYSIETPKVWCKTMGKRIGGEKQGIKGGSQSRISCCCLFACFGEKEKSKLLLCLLCLLLLLLPLLESVSMASSTLSRWLRPEVYPLFAAVGVAVGICGMQLVRNICSNPEVRVSKENRAAGVLDNFAEGEKYAQHSLRKFVRNKSPEIMPNINGFFADPK